ncbi:16S rRNA processing protein RimM [candidate division WOR-3 bacterium]|nr:16S rRNA processing protein RimM [candidate division WOR-3 bacterium]
MNAEFIPIGKIIKTHGLKGDVKAQILSDIPNRLKNISSIHLLKDGKTKKLTISYCQLSEHHAIIKFGDISSISCAEKIIGSMLCIKEEELLSLPKNRFYIHNLIGLNVYDKSGNSIGKLKEVWKLPANDVFVVKANNRETLFPAVKEAIKNISLQRGEIIVDENFGVT